MKLYFFPPSSNSRRVLAVAYHLGLDLELVPLSIPDGEQMTDEFIGLNPNHKIPTLVDDDGYVVWESTAIMLYLVRKFPNNSLYSSELKKQADIDRWLYWNIAHWSPACGVFVVEYLVKKLTNAGPPDQDALKKGEALFRRFAKVLDDQLSKGKWILGSDLTLADFASASFLDHAEATHMPVAGFENIKRWYEDIKGLDAWKKSAPANFMNK